MYSHKFKTNNISPPQPTSFTLCESNFKFLTNEEHDKAPVFDIYPHFQIPTSLSKPEKPQTVTTIPFQFNLFRFFDLFQHVKGLLSYIYPQTRVSLDKLPNKLFPQHKFSPIRCISWHKNQRRLALGLSNNIVLIYDFEKDQLSPPTLSLWNEFQTEILSLAWKPYSSNTLVVSTAQGVFIWSFHCDMKHFKTTSSSSVSLINIQNPPSNYAPIMTPSQTICDITSSHNSTPFPLSSLNNIWLTIKTFPSLSLITCIEWSPCGNFLAAASPTFNGIVIWDANLDYVMPIYCKGGTSILKWSPDGNYLFQGTTEKFFRIWETKTWTNKKWTGLENFPRHAAWGYPSDNNEGCSLVLAVVCGSVIQIYLISPLVVPPFIKLSLECLEDLEVYTINGMQGGGEINELQWDLNGERLAVSFLNSDLVAIFATKISSKIELTPLGFVRGKPKGPEENEKPQKTTAVCMEFLPCFSDNGALLGICFDSGEISFVPFYFNTKPSWSWV